MTCSCFKPQSHGGSDGDGKHDGADCDGKGEGVDSDYKQDGNQTTSFVRCHLFLPACLLWLWYLLQIQVSAQTKSKNSIVAGRACRWCRFHLGETDTESEKQIAENELERLSFRKKTRT